MISIDAFTYSILEEQRKQTVLLENILAVIQSNHESNVEEWKKANPELSRKCKEASHHLNLMVYSMLDQMIEDLEDTSTDYSFEICEFIDKYGYRFPQLNGLLNTLTKLGD